MLPSRSDCSQIVLLSDLQLSLPLSNEIVKFAAYFFHLLLIRRQKFGYRMSQAGHSLEVDSLKGCHVNNFILRWDRHLHDECVSYFGGKLAVMYALIAIQMQYSRD